MDTSGDSQNLTDEQPKWLAENREKIEAVIRDRLNKAGIKNVHFRPGAELSQDQIARLPGRVGIAQLNYADTSFRGLGFSAGTKGVTGGDEKGGPLSASAVFLGNLSAESLGPIRLPGFGLRGDDLAFGTGEVSAHEIGHRLGFDVVQGSLYWRTPTNLMTEGMGNPEPGRPLYFKPTERDRRIIQEINRIGDNTPTRSSP